jgi:hypothetical protein
VKRVSKVLPFNRYRQSKESQIKFPECVSTLLAHTHTRSLSLSLSFREEAKQKEAPNEVVSNEAKEIAGNSHHQREMRIRENEKHQSHREKKIRA